MTKFSDQLFTDLMHEHSATLRATQLPAAARGHSAVKRGAWLAGGAGTLAVGITAALATTSGGGAAAYAVTPHADGTVTVGISKSSGIPGANASLTALGDRVVVVPVRAGCESMDALRAPASKGGDVTVLRREPQVGQGQHHRRRPRHPAGRPAGPGRRRHQPRHLHRREPHLRPAPVVRIRAGRLPGPQRPHHRPPAQTAPSPPSPAPPPAPRRPRAPPRRASAPAQASPQHQ